MCIASLRCKRTALINVDNVDQRSALINVDNVDQRSALINYSNKKVSLTLETQMQVTDLGCCLSSDVIENRIDYFI
jgi:hypothetical protein